MAASVLAELDLHGLVDGHVEPDRRADLLRRLAGSPGDRALVEAWQDQADLIREAFRDVTCEALPAALDLAPPRLRNVYVDRVHATRTPSAVARHGGGAAITAALLITIGLTLSWMAGSRDESSAPAAGTRAATAGDSTETLPSFRVPDLSGSGLRLTEVSSDTGEPGTVVLRYRDSGAGRVALKVARNTPDIGPLPLERTGSTLRWRSQNTAFALGGTLPPDRLRSVAVALQGSD